MKTRKLHFGRIILITVISTLMVMPVYLLFKISISSPSEVLTQHPTFLIHHFDFSHWRDVFQSGNIWAPLEKSLIVATGTMALATLIVAPASYAISRLNRKVRFGYIAALFFTKMFPTVGIALPIAITFTKWGLVDSDFGLVMAHLIEEIPFMAWILLSTFSAIPKALEEAAMVDGANRMQALRYVVFPVAAQGIAVAAMYVWLNSWNEFTFALYLSLTTKTLPLEVYYYVQRGGFFETAAYSTLLAVPVILITFVLQRYLKSEYLSGAVK
ncbi:carbohydrate ABC transporter permease [Lapidilactobacillus salsurivasis]